MKSIVIVIAIIINVAYSSELAIAKEAFDNGRYSEALKHYSDACVHNNAEACWALGQMYNIGFKGIKKNSFKAIDYYEKGCSLGAGYSCNMVGQMYFQGKVVSKNDREALKYFERGCKLKDDSSCLGKVSLKSEYDEADLNDLNSVIVDIKLKTLSESCQKGNSKDCFILGVLYINGEGGVTKDFSKGTYYIDKSCKKGDVKSCLVALLYYVKLNEIAKAKQTFLVVIDFKKEACDKGDKKSCLFVAESYQNGIKYNKKVILETNQLKAKSFFEKVKLLDNHHHNQFPIQQDTLKESKEHMKLSSELKEELPDEFSKKSTKVQVNQTEPLASKIEKMDSQEKSDKALSGTTINEYSNKIISIIYENFFPPKNSQGKEALAEIELNADGKLIDFRLLKISGDYLYDSECNEIKSRLANVLFPKHPDNKSAIYKVVLMSE